MRFLQCTHLQSTGHEWTKSSLKEGVVFLDQLLGAMQPLLANGE